MKRYNLTSQETVAFVKLSEQLRVALEEKIDSLVVHRQFQNYIHKEFKLKLLNDEYDLVIRFTNEFSCNEQVAAASVCKAVKVWYGMYPNARYAVLKRFNFLYEAYIDNKVMLLGQKRHLGFVRLFMFEFVGILTNPEWLPICSPSSKHRD